MKADTFVKAIHLLRPTSEMYKLLGVSDSFINEYENRFNITLLRIEPHNSELENLIFNYNLDNFQIGLIDFVTAVRLNSNLVAFARVELDYLALDIKDGMIKYISNEDFKTINIISKNDDDFFLEILYEMFKFLQDCLLGHEKDPCLLAYKLTGLSKVPNASGFYKMILGCFS